MVKNKIRKSLFDQGQLLSDKFLLETSSKIQKNVIEEIDIESSKNTLLYFPYKKEIKLNLIINEIKSYSNNIYLPKIFPNKELRFNLLSDESIMVKNKYGISEIDDNKNYIGLEGFNMIFIPFVGVDLKGFRLGYGGGYFDRRAIFITFRFAYSVRKITPFIVFYFFTFQNSDIALHLRAIFALLKTNLTHT